MRVVVICQCINISILLQQSIAVIDHHSIKFLSTNNLPFPYFRAKLLYRGLHNPNGNSVKTKTT